MIFNYQNLNNLNFRTFVYLSKSAGNCKLTNKHKPKKVREIQMTQILTEKQKNKKSRKCKITCQKMREIVNWHMNIGKTKKVREIAHWQTNKKIQKSVGNCKLTYVQKTEKKCGKFKLPKFCQKVREIAHWQTNNLTNWMKMAFIGTNQTFIEAGYLPTY